MRYLEILAPLKQNAMFRIRVECLRLSSLNKCQSFQHYELAQSVFQTTSHINLSRAVFALCKYTVLSFVSGRGHISAITRLKNY